MKSKYAYLLLLLCTGISLSVIFSNARSVYAEALLDTPQTVNAEKGTFDSIDSISQSVHKNANENKKLLNVESEVKPGLKPVSRSHMSQSQTEQRESLEYAYQLLYQAQEQRDIWHYRESLVSSQKALEIAQSIGNLSVQAEALLGIASVFSVLQQYDRATDYYLQSTAIADEIGSDEFKFFVLLGLGSIHEVRSEYSEAIERYEQALVVAQNNGKFDAVVSLLMTIGDVYLDIGEPEQSLAFYEQSLSISRSEFSPPGFEKGNIELALAGLGNIYVYLNQYDRAIEFHRQGLEIAQNRIPDSFEEGYESAHLTNLGYAYLKKQQPQEAEKFLLEAVTLLQAGRRAGFNDIANVTELERLQPVFQLLQQALVEQGKYEEALNFSESSRGQALTEVVSRRSITTIDSSTNSEPANLVAIKDIARRRQTPVIVYSLPDGTGESIHTELSYFAIDIWIVLPNGRVEFRQRPIPESILAEASNMTRQTVAGFNNESGTIPQFSINERTGASLVNEAVWHTKPSRELLGELYDYYAFYLGIGIDDVLDGHYNGDLIMIPQLGIANQNSMLADNSLDGENNGTLVEYSLIYKDEDSSDLYIWVIQPNDDIAFRRKSIQNGELSKLADNFRYSISDRNRGFVLESSLQVDNTAILKRLHDLLISPIADLLPSNPSQEVIFIPHEEIFSVPFPALIDANEDYLIDKHTISTAPSIQILRQAQRKRQTLGKFTPDLSQEWLVVGNPAMPSIWNPVSNQDVTMPSLPFAEDEARNIGDLFSVEPLIGLAASEATIKSMIGNADVVHFATHGLLEYGNLADTGIRDFPGAIALAPGNGEDGLLTSSEILNLRLRANLVVLSACDTGRGDITGDGVLGLSRSLIAAGTPSVLVSLWSVPDESTSALMQSFYQHWGEGMTKAQALRKAMLETKDIASYSDPSSWAAFTLIGEGQ